MLERRRVSKLGAAGFHHGHQSLSGRIGNQVNMEVNGYGFVSLTHGGFFELIRIYSQDKSFPDHRQEQP